MSTPLAPPPKAKRVRIPRPVLPPTPDTSKASLGTFTAETLNAVANIEVRKECDGAYALVGGVIAVFVPAPSVGAAAQAAGAEIGDKLTACGVTLGTAEETAARFADLVAKTQVCDANRLAYRASVQDVNKTLKELRPVRDALEQQVRGALGTKAAELSRFGIKPAVRAKRTKRAAATKT